MFAAHQWVNMTDVSVQINDTHVVSMTEGPDHFTWAEHSPLLLTADLLCLCFCFMILFQAKTCKPALGYSFAAGTIDGVSGLNITQGEREDGVRASRFGGFRLLFPNEA